MTGVIIFGSTGSIGCNALSVIRALKGRFKVVGLAGNANIDLLAKQVEEFTPEVVCAGDSVSADRLRRSFNNKCRVLSGIDGLTQLAATPGAEIALMAISSSVALKPLLSAIDSGKKIALASKEALVMAGGIVIERARQKNTAIIPVDSEHSAIFQCINGTDVKYLSKIYLTATGGPLRKMAISKMRWVLPQQAMNHPKWSMGKKISVDSATMMNKGLEVIEAKWLFGIDLENIDILIHPEAIVHSMVEFIDSSVIAQMGVTDMRLPIQYALTYPDRIDTGLERLDFVRLGQLNFKRPNFKKFPCLELAYEAARQGGTMTAVLNAANEELVKLYLEGCIRLTDIAKNIEKVMKMHKTLSDPGLGDIINADNWARCKAGACYR